MGGVRTIGALAAGTILALGLSTGAAADDDRPGKGLGRAQEEGTDHPGRGWGSLGGDGPDSSGDEADGDAADAPIDQPADDPAPDDGASTAPLVEEAVLAPGGATATNRSVGTDAVSSPGPPPTPGTAGPERASSATTRTARRGDDGCPVPGRCQALAAGVPVRVRADLDPSAAQGSNGDDGLLVATGAEIRRVAPVGALLVVVGALLLLASMLRSRGRRSRVLLVLDEDAGFA